MTPTSSNHPEITSSSRIRLREGGWVILLATIAAVAALGSALVPALHRHLNRGPGDGVNIDSYGFDLSALTVSHHLVAPAMRYRDMPPRWNHPPTWPGAEIIRINADMYGKYLVTSDRIVGVVIGGEARAYPLSVLTLHNVINDTLDGAPIAITYNWLCDSPRVLRRTLDDYETMLGVSGLVYNSNLLFYDTPAEGTGESLWLQLTGRAISGPRAGEQMEVISSQLTTWGIWLQRYPETTVIQPDPNLKDRYKQMKPDAYFQTAQLLFPVEPLELGVDATDIEAKTRVVGVQAGGERRVYSLPDLMNRAADEDNAGVWVDELGGMEIRFGVDKSSRTVWVEALSSDAHIEFGHALWFAWHALWPTDELRFQSSNYP